MKSFFFFYLHCMIRTTDCKQNKPGLFCGKLKFALNLLGLGKHRMKNGGGRVKLDEGQAVRQSKLFSVSQEA